MKIEVNNNKAIEITKYEDNSLNIDIIDKNGSVEYFYKIEESEIVALLNKYQYENNIS